jgi:hypothetical protein
VLVLGWRTQTWLVVRASARRPSRQDDNRRPASQPVSTRPPSCSRRVNLLSVVAGAARARRAEFDPTTWKRRRARVPTRCKINRRLRARRSGIREIELSISISHFPPPTRITFAQLGAPTNWARHAAGLTGAVPCSCAPVACDLLPAKWAAGRSSGAGGSQQIPTCPDAIDRRRRRLAPASSPGASKLAAGVLLRTQATRTTTRRRAAAADDDDDD